MSLHAELKHAERWLQLLIPGTEEWHSLSAEIETIKSAMINESKQPWLTDPHSLDAQIALAREMWRIRVLACAGDQEDPTLIALSEIVIRLMHSPTEPT